MFGQYKIIGRTDYIGADFVIRQFSHFRPEIMENLELVFVDARKIHYSDNESAQLLRVSPRHLPKLSMCNRQIPPELVAEDDSWRLSLFAFKNVCILECGAVDFT